jgi:hypothetical protein
MVPYRQHGPLETACLFFAALGGKISIRATDGQFQTGRGWGAMRASLRERINWAAWLAAFFTWIAFRLAQELVRSFVTGFLRWFGATPPASE